MQKMLCLSLSFLLMLQSQLYAQAVLKSTMDDQTSVEVTIYNSNLGLIKDVRNLSLPQGQGEMRFMDVASSINPVTVRAKSLNHPDDFFVLEQNYEYDLISQSKLLDKYVGKDLKIVHWNEYQDRKEVVDATLISNNDGQVYRVKDEIFLGHPGYKVLPEIPGNLIEKPTLMWLYQAQKKKDHKLEVSYLTSNINWEADYVLVLNEADTALDLAGWVTINNRSGATYQEAVLKLVAGDVRRVHKRAQFKRTDVMLASAASDGAQFGEKSFFEYHIYDLKRKATLKQNQTKQILFTEADGVRVKKEYTIYGIQGYWTRAYSGRIPKQPVHVGIKFVNTEKNKLGIPLPAGVMRFYKKDRDESLQFIGEDRVSHTPKDEEIKLKLGKAFDITSERKQTGFKRVSNKYYETEWEISIKNHKEQAVTVGVVETLQGNWKVTKKSHPFKKEDAFTIRFDVKVPKNKNVKVKYGVKVRI